MTSIVIYEFGGMIPRSGDDYLPNEHASDAANCVLLSGDLEPLHRPALLNNFYPPLGHQERTDRFGPLPIPTDPQYDQCLVNILGGAPIIWIKGENGMVNDGSGSTYNWNAAPVRQAPTVTPEDWINFVGVEQQWIRLESEVPGNQWSLSPGGFVESRAPDSPANVEWVDIFNVAVFNATADQLGDVAGDLVPGWAFRWHMDMALTAQFGFSSITQFYRITEGNFPGGRNIFLESGIQTGPTGFIDVTDNLYQSTFEFTIEGSFIPGAGGGLNGADFNIGMRGFNPSRGVAGDNDCVEATDFTFNFALTFSQALPGFTETVDTSQYVFASGGFNIEVEDTGNVKFRLRDQATDEFFDTGYVLSEGEEAWCTLTFNNTTLDYNFYVNGVLEATYTGLASSPNFSITPTVLFGALSTLPGTEFPLSSLFKQFWYDTQELGVTDILNLYNASQGIPCP